MWGRPPRPPRPSANMCKWKCQKIIEGRTFWSQYWSQKLISDLELGGPDDFSYDLRGQPRPKITNIVILQSLKDGHFYILQNGQFGVEACGPTVLPDQKWQKVSILKNSNETFWMIFKQCVIYFLRFYLDICAPNTWVLRLDYIVIQSKPIFDFFDNKPS